MPKEICGEYYDGGEWDGQCSRKPGHKGKHRFVVKWWTEIATAREPHPKDCTCVGCLIVRIYSPVLEEQLTKSYRFGAFFATRGE